MGLVIDTGVTIEAERKRLRLSEILGDIPDSECFLSVITLSELLHGVERASTPQLRQKRIEFLNPILQRYPILPIDSEVARVHAVIWADLLSRGSMIGFHDLWIAATYIHHGHEIITLNQKDFRRVP